MTMVSGRGLFGPLLVNMMNNCVSDCSSQHIFQLLQHGNI